MQARPNIGYSDQIPFVQRVAFACKDVMDCIVEISEKHSGFGMSRPRRAPRQLLNVEDVIRVS